MNKKSTHFLFKHIYKLREELRRKDKAIKSAYDDLINQTITDNFKIALAGNRLAVELRHKRKKDIKFVECMNQLFIDEGEEPPFDIKSTESLVDEFLKKQPIPSLED